MPDTGHPLSRSTDTAVIDLFQAAETARDEALNRVQHNAPPDWLTTALDAVRDLCATQPTLTTDEVWTKVGQPPEPRALGAVMRAAQRAGYCIATDQTRKSARPEAHARPLRVWMSCRYRAVA